MADSTTSSHEGPDEPPSNSTVPTTASGDGPGGGRSTGRVALGVVTFLAGLLIGGLVVGFSVGGGDTSGSSGAAAGPDASSSSSPSASPSPSSASVSVNAACLRAINDAQAVANELAGLRSAATGLDVGALDQIVQRENVLQLRLRGEIKACQARVHLPDGSVSPTPIVTTSP